MRRGKVYNPKRPTEVLSAMELRILPLIAQGYTNTEIGEKLGKTEKNIYTYYDRIRDKLKLSNRCDITAFCLKHGVINRTISFIFDRHPAAAAVEQTPSGSEG